MPRVDEPVGPPEAALATLSELYGPPAGEFLRGRFGVTHYLLEDMCDNFPGEGERAPIAVLAHGVGASLSGYADFAEALRETGFRVLRYDLLGHGFSYAEGGAKYSVEELSTQLHELFELVLEEGEPVDIFVGHSAGGVLGVQAAMSLPTMPGGHHVKRLALISPAFWKSAGIVGSIADRLPRLAQLQASARVFKIARNACLDNIHKANEAFATQHDYQCLRLEGQPRLYKEGLASATAFRKRKFELHPQIQWAIFGILTRVLAAGAMAKRLATFQSLVESQAEPRTKLGLFWGTMDNVVPLEHAQEVQSWAGGDKVALVRLPGLGHESILEDPRRIVDEILRWAGFAVCVDSPRSRRSSTGSKPAHAKPGSGRSSSSPPSTPVLSPRSAARLIFTPRDCTPDVTV